MILKRAQLQALYSLHQTAEDFGIYPFEDDIVVIPLNDKKESYQISESGLITKRDTKEL